MNPKEEYVTIRKKEELAFMVVKFLKAYDVFNDIYVEFDIVAETNNIKEHAELILQSPGLFDRIKELEEGNMFQLKNIAHFLFRTDVKEDITEKYAALYKKLEDRLKGGHTDRAKPIMSDILLEQIRESLDWTMGQTFHHLMILRENLYLLKEYEPRYKAEEKLAEKIEAMAQSKEYTFSLDEHHELGHIEDLDKISNQDLAETKESVIKSIPRLKERFERTAELLRHYIIRVSDTETIRILGKNLRINEPLVEKIYGEKNTAQLLEYTKEL